MIGAYEQFQLDAYTPLSYKKVLASRSGEVGIDWMAPTWLGPERRRIQAYMTLAGYRDNAARMLIAAISQEERDSRDQRREYGDAALLVEQIRSALLGDQQTISVEGADDYDPDATPQDLESQQQQVQAFRAAERQEFLLKWAEDERLTTKLVETERNAVALGDGLYSLGFNPVTGRVTLRTWDPSVYFPVLTDGDENEYPNRVHLAWELVDDPRDGYIRVRRITYDMRDVAPYSVPWESEAVTRSCFLTDATFTLDRESRSPDDFNADRAAYAVDEAGEVRDRDLGIDFVPVIHIPNTVSLANHFGQSSLAKVLQILDDIQATDSDLQAASALTGSPMFVFSGANLGSKLTVGPGEAVNLGPNGQATAISGADGLAGLAQYRDDLLRRVSVNSRVPEAVLGRVDPSKIQAGIVLSLSFGPLGSLIDEMRLVRRDKYRLLLKFVQRFYLKEGSANGGIDGDVMTADVVFGSFLPSDRAGTVDMVTKLITAKLISRQTAQKMLQEVGVPIDDLVSESDEIDKRDYENAIRILDATGNPTLVSEFLGGVEVGAVTPPTVPPVPGDQGQSGAPENGAETENQPPDA
jgi:hypothetical protein